jgi:hypothetical protein
MGIDAQRVLGVNTLFASRIIALPITNHVPRAIGSVAEAEREGDVPLDAARKNNRPVHARQGGFLLEMSPILRLIA